MKLAFLLAIAGLLAGCASSGSGKSIIPDSSLKLTSAVKLPLSSIATGALVLGAVHLVYDPLAPNWEIEEIRLDEETFRFSLRMKRFHTGGAGESMLALKRRAQQLQTELGFGGYQIMEYSEGIDSQTLGARRVAESTVKLVNRQVADSFLQNGR